MTTGRLARAWLLLPALLGQVCAISGHGEGEAEFQLRPELRLLSVIPSNGDRGTNLYGRTAISVVYSRAVIALGSDWNGKGDDGKLPKDKVPFQLVACKDQPEFAVPGRIRWTTTSTARFDAEVDWPSDLCFDVVLNEGLRSFDGLPVAGEAKAWRFTTSPMHMHLSSVRSKEAERLTGGLWSSQMLGDHASNKHECPPDGVVRLSFSSAIDHALAFRSLQQANPGLLGAAEESKAFDKCGRSCIAVRPRGLEAAKDYRLVFPKGGRYSLIAGRSGAEQTVNLVGLLAFDFPFRFPAADKSWGGMVRGMLPGASSEPGMPGLRFRRQMLYLRHGLAPPGAGGGREKQLEALKAAMTLSDDRGARLAFNLSLANNATLRLDCARLEPKRRYVLSVRASGRVRDGYGQPLQPCSTEFRMEEAPSIFTQADDSPAYFRDSPGNWKVLAGGTENFYCGTGPGYDRSSCGSKRPYVLRAHNIAPEAIQLALADRYNTQQSFLAAGGQVEAPLVPEARALSVGTSPWIEQTAAGDSGLFLRELITNSGSIDNKAFVSVAPFGAALVATPTGQLLVWATSFATGEGVVGAQVVVYRIQNQFQAQLADIVEVARGQTAADGTALLSPAPGQAWRERRHYGNLVAVVISTEPKGTAICEETPMPEPVLSRSSRRVVMLTDRTIYRPGDSVHLKGYLRNVNAAGTSLAMPKAMQLKLEVVWKRSNRGRPTPQTVDVELVPGYGTFTAELKVPASADDVTYGGIAVTLKNLDGPRGRPEHIAMTTITIADPRPPTATLKLSTEAKLVLPGAAASIDLDVQAETYSGTGVEGAEVEVTWTLHRAASGADRDGGEVVGVQVSTERSPSHFGRGGGMMPFMMPPMPPGSGAAPTGQLTITTGKGGAGHKTVELAQLLETAGEDGGLADPCAEGDRLSFSARWVGPTREVITAELEGGDVRVARSQYELAVRPVREVDDAVGTPLPGTPFPVYVDLRRAARGGDAAEAGGGEKPQVTLSLHEWDGRAPVREAPPAPVALDAGAASMLAEQAKRSTGLRPVSEWGKEALATCTVLPDGGAAASCSEELTLPAPRRYVVLAQATAPDGVKLVTAFAVGRTEEEWTARPLASLGQAVSVHADKSAYKVGDTARLTLSSPFRGATAMLVWEKTAAAAETRSTQVKMVSLGSSSGQHVINFTVGEECRYGCNVAVAMAAPSQERKLMLPVEVPVSPLLDITLPQTSVQSVHLDVPDTGRSLPEGQVQVSVLKGEKAAEVLEPGETATLEVQASPKAEVCIFVVDKAMLDVGGAANPHPVVKLDERFELQRHGQQLASANTVNGLASAKGYQATVDTALRRAAIDPWTLEYGWPLQPRPHDLQAVEQTDEDYFASRADTATHFPGSWGGAPMPMMAGVDEMAMDMDDGANGAPQMAMLTRAAPPPMAMAAMAEAAPMAAPMVADEAEMGGGGGGGAVMAKSMKMRSAKSFSAVTTTTRPSAGGAGAGGAGAGGAALGKAAYLRTNFETTPLFVGRKVADGSGRVQAELKLPDNIATFEVRAYVVDGDQEHKFGHATASVVSRRQVSMVPALPRVVRPGDRFDCGVSLTGHALAGEGQGGWPAGGVEVVADVASQTAGVGLVAFREADLEAFRVRAGGGGRSLLVDPKNGSGCGPHEVVFPFATPSAQRGGGIGSSRLRFSARLPGKGGRVVDALEANVTVKPNQSPVHIGTSMVITARSSEGSKEWEEGLELPDATPGSGDVVLTAGVGHLPAVVANAADVTGREMTNGQTLASALLPAASLALYYTPRASPPAEAATSAGLEKVASAFAHAVRALPAYTASSGPYPIGLVWRPEDMHSHYYTPRADVSLNAFGCFAARLVGVLAGKSAPGSTSAGFLSGGHGEWAALNLLVPTSLTTAWRTALERELQRQVAELHRSPRCTSDCYRSWETLAAVRAALGWDWQPRDSLTQAEMRIDRLFAEDVFEHLSPRALAHAALAYTLSVQMPSEAAERLDAIYHRLANLVRIQGRTTYIAAADGSPHSAGLGANALVLLALAQGGREAMAKHFVGDSGSSLVAKLAEYAAGGGTDMYMPFGGGRWMGVRDAAVTGAAEAMYDRAVGSTQPDVRLSAMGGDKELMQYRASGAAPPPATASVAWEELARPPPPISFIAEGSGQVSITASLTFVPAATPTEGAIVRGCLVEKVVQKMDPATGKASGPPLQIAELGSSVIVTIQVTVADDLSRVTLEDLSAGGLEPVDPAVAGDNKGSVESGCNRRGRFWGWWCWPAFSYRETFADRVAWSSGPTLPAGTHTVSYQAVAATRGVFSLPPAHCFVNSQPELMGLSRAGTLVVADAAGPGGKAVPEPTDQAAVDAFLAQVGVEKPKTAPPMPCRGKRPEGGACDTERGKWVCFKGFKYGDCETLADVENKWESVLTPFPSSTGATPYRPSATASGAVLIAMLAVASLIACFRRKARGGGVAEEELCPCPGSTPYHAGPPMPPSPHDTEMSVLMSRGEQGIRPRSPAAFPRERERF